MSKSQLPSNAPIVGIDLGTTNSSVGLLRGGEPVLLPIDGSSLLPSVVGLAADGSMLVGHSARRQAALYPERTVSSVKRLMGEEQTLTLGEERYRPEEIAALILGRLKRAAEEAIGEPVTRALITVPAYFTDAQRTATREAGEIAGFHVERILHEPTAAALCYDPEAQSETGSGGQDASVKAADETGEPEEADRVVLVYDLGGGTFDVSLVRLGGQLTEVLASHGDTALGGDDFDALLATRLREDFEAAEGCSIDGNLSALARLKRAAEEAKIRLSEATEIDVTEEHLVTVDGVGRHLEQRITRQDYEGLIRPLLDRTRDSVQVALREAGLVASDLDEILLVGGSSRTPLVHHLLEEQLGMRPRMDVDPDCAVALGATLQAGRLGGFETARVLVDVTPFSFGTSAFDEGELGPHFFVPVIHRNTPLPTKQVKELYTMIPGQRRVEVKIYQGEQTDVRQNQQLGTFMVSGLDPEAPEMSPILFELGLNLDGILEVSVIEKHTRLRKDVTIEDSFRRLDEVEIAAARARVTEALSAAGEDSAQGFGKAEALAEEIHEQRAPQPALETADAPPPGELDATQASIWAKARALLDKAERLAPTLGDGDRRELEQLSTQLSGALETQDWQHVISLEGELADVLFYLE